MKLQLLMIGAGEFRSFQDGVPTSYFLRFMAVGGATLDLPVNEDQLGAVLSFAAEGTAPAAEPAAPRAPSYEEQRAREEPEPWVPPREEAPRGDSAPIIGLPPVIRARPPLVFGEKSVDDDEREL